VLTDLQTLLIVNKTSLSLSLSLSLSSLSLCLVQPYIASFSTVASTYYYVTVSLNFSEETKLHPNDPPLSPQA